MALRIPTSIQLYLIQYVKTGYRSLFELDLLPLPLGEGWGEGFKMFHYSWCFPHPSLLP